MDEATFNDVKNNGYLVVSQEKLNEETEETKRETFKVPVKNIEDQINNAMKSSVMVVNLVYATWNTLVYVRSNGYNMIGVNNNQSVFEVVVNNSDEIIFENIQMGLDSDGNNTILKRRYRFLSSGAKESTTDTITIPVGGSGSDFDPNGRYDSSTGKTLSCNKVNGVTLSFSSSISTLYIA